MVNVVNVRRVADAIERHEIADLGFNMAEWFEADGVDFSGHSCGTAACIGGTAGLVIFGKKNCSEFQAACALGLANENDGYSEDEADQLFYPRTISRVKWHKITPAQAVRTLRHLADTGVVDWDLPEPAL